MDRGRDVAALDQVDPAGARVTWRRRVEYAPASERRFAAQDDAVAAGGHGRRGQPQLRVPLSDPANDGWDLGGAVVDMDAGAVLDRRELLERDVEPVARRVGARIDQRLAAVELSAFDARQADGDTLPGFCALDRPVVHLHAANAHREAGRLGAKLVTGADRPRPKRAGRDGADAPQRERAVDMEARRS